MYIDLRCYNPIFICTMYIDLRFYNPIFICTMHIDLRFYNPISYIKSKCLFQICEDEYTCLKKRKRMGPGKGEEQPTCTQRERDLKYGKGWPWNTRNCEALTKGEKKLCKREKRKRCIQREKSNGKSERSARKNCGGDPRKKFKIKDCLDKLAHFSRNKAKRKCKTRKSRYLKKLKN